MPVIAACYLFIEIGNFPVYVMYYLFTRPNKAYLYRWYNIISGWKFVWFMIFNIIIVGWVLNLAVCPITLFLGITLQMVNGKWVNGVSDKVRQSFST
jgi:hypothetical protein